MSSASGNPAGTDGAPLTKGQRAAKLLSAFQDCADLAASMGWQGGAIVRNGRLLIEQDGGLFHPDPRYFRTGGLGIARPMRLMLEQRSLPVRTVFDVGANLGEVAIGFALNYPSARVFAFEPAPENLEVLDANVALQPKRLRNLTVVREAMSDRPGEIEMTLGAGDLNTVMLDDNLERLAERRAFHVARVPTDTLESYCDRLDVQAIDFLKIDIEGAEPLLSPSIRALAGRIGSAFVEVSRYGSLDAYVEMVDAFAAGGLVMEFRNQGPIADPRRFLEVQLERFMAQNIWFLPRR